MFLGNGAVSVQADEIQSSQIVESTDLQAEKVQAKPTENVTPVAEVATKPVEVTTQALDKTQLESYIADIEATLANGFYDNKTEESVALLKNEVASAKSVLETATSQDQLSVAYRILVTTTSSKLKNKPVEKKETPAVDTTEGKKIVAKPAENTEKKSESNSIENTGSNDPRNGKALDKNNAFRAETDQEAPTVEIPYANDKNVYVYGAEEDGFNIKIKDNSGVIQSATVLRGGNNTFTPVAGETDMLNVQYGYKANIFTSDTTASEQSPAIIHYRGVPGGELNAAQLEKVRTTGLTLGWRYVRVYDKAGNILDNVAQGDKSKDRDLGAFNVIAKPQTFKYDPVELTNANKVLVTNPAQLTTEELANVKNSLKVEYSKTNDDAQLASKKGTLLDDAKTVVADVTESGNNFTVTYKDGSTDSIAKSKLIKSGIAPTVNTKSNNTVFSTDEELTGTGTPGATVKVTVKDPAGTTVISEETTEVGSDGNWKLALSKGLNSNEVFPNGSTASNTFYAPKNKVEVMQVVNGISTPEATVTVSEGGSTILPSAAAKDGKSVVAGAKEVRVTIPHDAGIAYFWYTNKTDNSKPQIDIKRESDGSLATSGNNAGKATVTNVVKGNFYDTVTLTLTEPAKEGANLEIIPHNGLATKGTYLGRASIPVTNEKPVVSSATGSDVTTVNVGGTVDLSTLAKVTDHEDDQNATLGTKGTPTVVSINGDTSKTTLEAADLAAPGTFIVKYKALDSQGKESDEYEHTVKVNQAPTVELPYSNQANKQIYVYTGENTDLTFKATDNTAVKDMYVRGPGGIGNDNTANYGFATGKIENSAVTHGDGTVSGATATIKMTGVTTLTAPNRWTSFVVANDNDNAPSTTDFNALDKNPNATQTPGYVQFIVKSQTDKYDIKAPTEKVEVADPANVTEDDLARIKEKLKLEYNKNNDDANILKDAAVENKDDKISSVTKDDQGNLVVTYKDGSKDTRALSDFVNKAPTVELPYSNQANKQIYVYTGENTDLTFTGNDENEVKDLYLRGPGDISWNNTTGYGLTTGKVENGAVTGEGSVSEDKTSATIKMTGVTNLRAGQQWTSFVVSKDNDGKLSNTDYRALDKDSNARQKPGYVQFIVKNQTSKYDIATPTEKVEVANPANVTENDLAKVKEKLQIEYAQTNDDANFAGRKGTTVAAEDAKTKIKSVTKDADGNLVVTYTDGSTDKKPLSEFVTKDTTAPAKPEVKTDLAGKAGTKTPVEVSAEPGSTVELFDKDGNSLGTGVANDQGVASITPTKDIPAGGVTAKATDPSGNTSDASEAKVATDTTAPAKPEVKTDLAGKAGTKTPVEVSAEPGSTVELFDKAGNKIGEATADENGKAKITPTVDIPEGNVTVVATKDGQTPEASDPVPATTAKDPATPAKDAEGVKDPEAKTPVKDPANLTDAEKAKVAEEVKKANPTAKDVEVGKDGTATVTFPDGSTAEIPAAKAVEKAKDAEGLKDPEAKTPVKDPANLTDAEKAKVAEEVKKANPTAKDVEVGKDGTTTVTFPDGSTAEIPAAKAVEKAKDTEGKDAEGVKDPEAKTPVKDPANLTDAEKAKVAEEVKKANPTAKDVEVGKDGTTTVTFPDGSTAEIPADKTVKKSDGSVAVNPAANQDSPAQAPAKKAGAKELPNTGTAQSSASLALALLAAATGGLLFAKKREEEE